MKKNVLLVTLFFLILSWGCKEPAAKGTDVAVSILPQKFIVDRISGKTLSVMVTVPSGQSPATYEMTANEAKQLSTVKLYLRIGHIMFEKSQWKSILSVNSTMKYADVSKGVKLIGNNHDHHHNHENVDPHIWLSPRAMKIIAVNTFNALVRLVPSKKKVFRSNLNGLLGEIDNLDKTITARLKNRRGMTFMVFHPAWTYFAHDYGIKQIAIETDGKEPGVAHIKRIIDEGKKAGVAAVLIQKQFPEDVAKAIADDLRMPVVKIDPLDYNWFKTINTIADVITGKK